MDRRFLLLGAFSGFLAVAAGAFGAHALRQTLPPDLLAVFETGARYQMYHALALVLVASLRGGASERLLAVAGYLFVAGTLLFSGSLYLLALTGTRWWGAVTPVGGVCFLAGWVCLGMAAIGTRNPTD